jgi:predicted small metal-binding protein
LIVYEFLCERIIPGCTHKESGEDRDVVLEKALEHMREHREDLDDPGEEVRDQVIGEAMIYLPR